MERRSVSVTVSIQMSGQYFWIHSDTSNRRGSLFSPPLFAAPKRSLRQTKSLGEFTWLIWSIADQFNGSIYPVRGGVFSIAASQILLHTCVLLHCAPSTLSCSLFTSQFSPLCDATQFSASAGSSGEAKSKQSNFTVRIYFLSIRNCCRASYSAFRFLS